MEQIVEKLKNYKYSVKEVDIYNVLKNVAGTSLSINDAMNYKVVKTEINGNSYQETRSGKNLLQIKDGTYTSNGITLTVKDSILTFNGTNNGTESAFILSTNEVNTKENTKIKCFQFGGSVSNQDAPHFYSYVGWDNIIVTDFTQSTIKKLDNNLTYNNFNIGIKSGTFNNYSIGVLVAENITEETSYEPYTGGIASPNPDYPQEIEVVEAYNLFDKNTCTDGYFYNDIGVQILEETSFVSDYISVEKKSYILIGNDTTSVIRICTYDENKTFVRRVAGSGKMFITIDIAENEKYVIVSSNKLTVKETMMFTKGTIPRQYLPYNKLKLTIKNSNLFSISDFSLGGMEYGNIDTSKKYRINNVSSPIPVEPSKEYIININDFGAFKGLRVGIHTCAKDGSFVHDSGWINLKNNTPYHFKTRDDAKFLKMLFSGSLTNEEVISYSNEDTTAFASPEEWLRGVEIKIGQSEEATLYELSEQNISYIDLQDNFIGKLPNGTKDRLYIQNNHLYLEKRVGKVVLDGSELWRVYTDSYANYQRYIVNVKNSLSSTSRNPIICTHFKYMSSGHDFGGAFQHDGSLYFYPDTTKITTTDEWKEWLSNNPTTVYYELAEPQIINLGQLEEDIEMLEDTNNITLLSNLETDFNVSYYSKELKDISNYKFSVKEV